MHCTTVDKLSQMFKLKKTKKSLYKKIKIPQVVYSKKILQIFFSIAIDGTLILPFHGNNDDTFPGFIRSSSLPSGSEI